VDGPPRRYYTLSPDGARHFQTLSASWVELATTVNRLIANKK
jgi:DNA-binding PadR family transcriptional regulator